MSRDTKKYTKQYGQGYISDGGIPGAKFWVTEEKSYTIFDPRKKDDPVKLPKEKKKFNYPLLARGLSCLLGIIILTSSLHDGTFRFIEGYKVTMNYNDYDCEFYNYDWTFKLKQLSRLRPMFSAERLFDSDQIHNVSQMNPYDYLEEFTYLYNDGAIRYTGNNNRNKVWELNEDYLNFDYAYYIFNYRYYTTGISEVMGGVQARNNLTYYSLDNPIVWADNGNWIKQYEKSISGGFPFWDSIIVVLTIPEKLTYNTFVCLDFLMRW